MRNKMLIKLYAVGYDISYFCDWGFTSPKLRIKIQGKQKKKGVALLRI